MRVMYDNAFIIFTIRKNRSKQRPARAAQITKNKEARPFCSAYYLDRANASEYMRSLFRHFSFSLIWEGCASMRSRCSLGHCWAKRVAQICALGVLWGTVGLISNFTRASPEFCSNWTSFWNTYTIDQLWSFMLTDHSRSIELNLSWLELTQVQFRWTSCSAEFPVELTEFHWT